MAAISVALYIIAFFVFTWWDGCNEDTRMWYEWRRIFYITVALGTLFACAALRVATLK